MDMNIAAMYEKLSTQSNANQSAHAMRVGTALEAADASDRHAARGGKMVSAGLPGEAEAH